LLIEQRTSVERITIPPRCTAKHERIDVFCTHYTFLCACKRNPWHCTIMLTIKQRQQYRPGHTLEPTMSDCHCLSISNTLATSSILHRQLASSSFMQISHSYEWRDSSGRHSNAKNGHGRCQRRLLELSVSSLDAKPALHSTLP
jgi:hypothetical protein